MGLETTVKPETLQEDKNSLVYSISHGSGGFNATYEAVKVFYSPEEKKPFIIKFITPAGSSVRSRHKKLEVAIKQAQNEAEKSLKRTVRNADYTMTTKDHDNYPEGIPSKLQRFI
jgi:hypothetical protein